MEEAPEDGFYLFYDDYYEGWFNTLKDAVKQIEILIVDEDFEEKLFAIVKTERVDIPQPELGDIL